MVKGGEISKKSTESLHSSCLYAIAELKLFSDFSKQIQTHSYFFFIILNELSI